MRAFEYVIGLVDLALAIVLVSVSVRMVVAHRVIEVVAEMLRIQSGESPLRAYVLTRFEPIDRSDSLHPSTSEK